VLSHRWIPPSVLLLLQDHFAWLDDFRTARLLGAGRAHALHDALADLPRPITDPATLRHHAETLLVNRLLDKGHELRALLAVAMMGHVLQRQLAGANPWLLRRLGLEPGRQQRVGKLLNQAAWVRTAALAVLVFGASLVIAQDLAGAAWGTLTVALYGHGVPFLALLLLMVVDGMRKHLGLPPSWMKLLHRLGNWLPWLGIGLFTLSALGLTLIDRITVLPAAQAGWLFVAGFLLTVCGLVCALPAAINHALVAAMLLWAGVTAFQLKEPLPIALTAAWVLAGMQVYLRGLYRPSGDGAPPRLTWPRGGWQALVLLTTIGLPTLAAWLTDVAGFRIVIAALVLPSALRTLDVAVPPYLLLPVATVLAGLLMLASQHLSLKLVHRFAALRG
jgi:hypothetical protein